MILYAEIEPEKCSDEKATQREGGQAWMTRFLPKVFQSFTYSGKNGTVPILCHNHNNKRIEKGRKEIQNIAELWDWRIGSSLVCIFQFFSKEWILKVCFNELHFFLTFYYEPFQTYSKVEMMSQWTHLYLFPGPTTNILLDFITYPSMYPSIYPSINPPYFFSCAF